MIKEKYFGRYKIEFRWLSSYSFLVGFSVIAIGWHSHIGCNVFSKYFYFTIMGFGFTIFWN